MKKVKQIGLLLAVALVMLLGVAACSTNTTNGNGAVAIDQAEVRSIVENMLNGYNAGDYEMFSRDLAPQLKLVINEEMFNNFRAQSEQTLGQFQSIASIEQIETGSDSTSWRVSADFDNSTQQFTVTFNNSTGQIEGMDFGQVP